MIQPRIRSYVAVGGTARCAPPLKFSGCELTKVVKTAPYKHHHRVSSREALGDDNGGMGGDGGSGGSNFGGNDGWNFEEDGGSGRRGPNPRPLIIVAALLAIVFSAPKVFGTTKKAIAKFFGSSEYNVEPTAALKRLVRELFEKDVNIQSRLAEVERRLGIVGSSGAVVGASRVATSTGDSAPSSSDSSSSLLSSSHGHTSHLGGRLTLGGGFMWSSSAENLEAVVESGVQLGTQLTLQSRGKLRNGRDFILTDINIDGASQEQFNLQKVLYSCGLLKNLRVSLAPFGARGNDVTYTLNPFSGRGLTDATAEGNPLMHNRGRGAAVGATVSLPRMWLTGAVFRNEEEVDGDKVLLQAIVAPIKRLSVGLSMLEGPSGDSMLSQQLARFLDGTPTTSPGEVAATVALSLGDNLALHGWAASSSFDSIVDRKSSATTWNVSLGDTLRDGTSRWVASVGKVSEATKTTGANLEPDSLEFSTEFDLGSGMTVQPGVVAVRDQRDQWTILAGAKACWDF